MSTHGEGHGPGDAGPPGGLVEPSARQYRMVVTGTWRSSASSSMLSKDSRL
jgi:hypothetical protein